MNNVMMSYFRRKYIKTPDDSLPRSNTHITAEIFSNKNLSWSTNLDQKEKVSSQSKINFYLTVSFIGAIRGATSLLIEHPLESIKTQWQDKNNIKSTRDIVKNIYAEKGMIGFYRGFSPNCVRAVFKNCYRWPMMLFFPSFFYKTLPQNLVQNFSGLPKILTGLAIANIEIFIICPLDRLKIFFMTSSSKGVNMFKYFYMNHKENMIKELFRGLGVSFWRSNVSWVSFLYLDYKLKRIFKQTQKIESLGIFDLFVISIFVGVGNLASIMPFDFVKTQMQKEGCIDKQGTLSTLNYYYKNFGLRILYTGWQFKMFQYLTQSLFTVTTLEILETKSKNLHRIA